MTQSAKIITRFAPSPSGDLHLGHAYSAKLSYDFSVQKGGDFILRIEDIDHLRCKAEHEKSILTVPNAIFELFFSRQEKS